MDWIQAAPKFWQTIRPRTLAVKNNGKAFDSLYQNMASLYAGFEPPDICFAISPMRTGGTTSKGLILIGTEIATVHPKHVDISEIGGFFKKIFENGKGDIKSMIAHELIHTQQPGGDNEDDSLLSQTIVEGTADFIGSLILGEPTMNSAIYKYGEENELALWKEFKEEIDNQNNFDETD